MNKKLFSIVLALVLMVFAVSGAFAVPSKTTANLVSVDTNAIVTSTGVAIASDFSVGVVAEDKNVDDEFDSIALFLSNGRSLIEYFSDSLKTQIGNLGLDTSNLQMNEFFAFQVGNYDPAYGDMSFTFGAAAEYEVGQEIVVLVGIPDSFGNMEWYAFAAIVNGDHKVEVTFTEDVLELMGNSPVALAFLS